MTTTITTSTPATTGTSIIAHQLGFVPAVRRFTHDDGTPTVAVGLCGLHGAGREMILDAADWHYISETISPWWQVQRMSGVEYVVCSNKTAIETARATSKVRMLFLSRYLAKPAEGLVVRYANGNRLDCRRANLLVVDRAAHSRANVATRQEGVMKRRAEQMAAMAAANAAATTGGAA